MAAATASPLTSSSRGLDPRLFRRDVPSPPSSPSLSPGSSPDRVGLPTSGRRQHVFRTVIPPVETEIRSINAAHLDPSRLHRVSTADRSHSPSRIIRRLRLDDPAGDRKRRDVDEEARDAEDADAFDEPFVPPPRALSLDLQALQKRIRAQRDRWLAARTEADYEEEKERERERRAAEVLRKERERRYLQSDDEDEEDGAPEAEDNVGTNDTDLGDEGGGRSRETGSVFTETETEYTESEYSDRSSVYRRPNSGFIRPRPNIGRKQTSDPVAKFHQHKARWEKDSLVRRMDNSKMKYNGAPPTAAGPLGPKSVGQAPPAAIPKRP
ncbi:hypothetical protein HK101_004816 [Irineochytrium annulatum]|nr:hypothetical protein HK101_004816 [Irineochytrium annulatum]